MMLKSINKNSNRKTAQCSTLIAFTLAEVMLTLFIMGIVGSFVININKSRTNYVNKFMYYSAFNNLQQGIGEIIGEGCRAEDLAATPSPYCAASKALPLIGHNADSRGLCDRLSDLYNTTGPIDCTQTGTTTPNFATKNDARYFNLGSNAVSNSYTVYIDIDGTKRTGTLGVDLLPFFVTTAGVVYPYYVASDATGASNGATLTGYLSTNVAYKNASGVYVFVDNGVSYYTAVCEKNGTYYGSSCSAATVTTYTNNCAPATGHTCEVIINKPGY